MCVVSDHLLRVYNLVDVSVSFPSHESMRHDFGLAVKLACSRLLVSEYSYILWRHIVDTTAGRNAGFEQISWKVVPSYGCKLVLAAVK